MRISAQLIGAQRHQTLIGTKGAEDRMIYRCEGKARESRVFNKRGSRRTPGNVPYVVDNLWEWKRPEGFPNRRHSLFASPKPELARKYSQYGDKGVIYAVEPLGECLLAQIKEEDARCHDDCRKLPRTLIRLLGEGWADKPVEEKDPIAVLWTPCLLKEEVDGLFRKSPLALIRKEIWDSITFWETAKIFAFGKPLPFEEGEIMMEAEKWKLSVKIGMERT